MRLSDIDWSTWKPTDRATLLFVVDREKNRVLLIEKKRGLGAGKVNGPGAVKAWAKANAKGRPRARPKGH